MVHLLPFQNLHCVFGLIYAGTDDGHIHLTKDAGSSWMQVGAGKKKGTSLPKDLWGEQANCIFFQEGRVYATLNGYRFRSFRSLIYLSVKIMVPHGLHWEPILPLEPINVVKEDPKNENILYVGTDGGCMSSLDRGKSFMKWNGGIPKAGPVHDLTIQKRDYELVVGTHGRSIYISNIG
jgi:photosystem II stability/assembly factor-like uncharacterized protein